MIKQLVADSINAQLTREMYSSNLYLSMSAYFSSINLNGFANWMRVQAQEEMFHALKFFDYLLDRGGVSKVGAISAPPSSWDSPLAAFQDAFHHEQLVTDSINQMAELAMKENDFATNIMLQWFISEQVEEEKNANDIVERIKLAGDSRSGLFLLDSELKTRVFVPPPPTK
ncbi:MAG: Ferroxidase [Ignavibacteria bacterium]|nr:Ferroxidase [Ignavibacteria bacterium]